MDTKILIEEINRINELTVSKAIFTENTDVNIDREEPWVLTEQSKKILSKVDDIFRVGTGIGKSSVVVKGASITLPKTWKVFKNLSALNTGSSKAGSKIKSYLSYGIKTKNMNPALLKIIGTTDDVGGAIAKNLHTAKMKKFLSGGSAEAQQIRKNISYSLEKSSALTTTLVSTNKFKITTTVKPKVVPKLKTKTRNPKKLTVKQIKTKTGVVVKKLVPALKTVWGGTKTSIKYLVGLGWTKKILGVVGIWWGATWVMGLFENGDAEMDLEQKMKSALTSLLAYAANGSDIAVSQAQASTMAAEVAFDHSRLVQYVKDTCVTLQDVSMISYEYLKNQDAELYDVLVAFKDTEKELSPGLGGVYGELEPLISPMPIISLGGVLCYTTNQIEVQAKILGIDINAAPVDGKLVETWANYPCVLTMMEDYDGAVGQSGDVEYVKITIDSRDAYFLPDGNCQIEDLSNSRVNLKGTYKCAGESVEVTDFNESRKLSDILKENNIINEETITFGNTTITVGGSEDPSDTDYNDGVVSQSTTTNTTGSGVKYVITSVTLADVVSGNGTLKKGDMGDSVRAIQTAVNTKADSKFGPNTEEAVRVYQKRNGLTITGTITQETAKRIAGSTDVDQGKVNTNVTTKKAVVITKTDANEMDKVVTGLDNTEKVYIEDQIADLETQVSKAPTKQACKTLIASAKAGIKKGVYLKDLSSLKQCYNSYNFYAWGDGSKKVRKHYGLQGKGNI